MLCWWSFFVLYIYIYIYLLDCDLQLYCQFLSPYTLPYRILFRRLIDPWELHSFCLSLSENNFWVILFLMLRGIRIEIMRGSIFSVVFIKLFCLVDGISVTLYRWPAKQTIPLSVLARNQTKGFWTWNLGVAGRGNGTREESWLEKGADKSGRRDTERGSRLPTQ